MRSNYPNQVNSNEFNSIPTSVSTSDDSSNSDDSGVTYYYEPMTTTDLIIIIAIIIVLMASFVLTILFMKHFKKYFLDFTPVKINTALVVLITVAVVSIIGLLTTLIIYLILKKKYKYRKKFAMIPMFVKGIVPVFMYCLYYWAGKDCAIKEYGYLVQFRLLIIFGGVFSASYETYTIRSGIDVYYWNGLKYGNWRVFFSSILILLPLLVLYLYSRLCIILPVGAMWVVMVFFSIFLLVFSVRYFTNTKGRLRFLVD